MKVYCHPHFASLNFLIIVVDSKMCSNEQKNKGQNRINFIWLKQWWREEKKNTTLMSENLFLGEIHTKAFFFAFTICTSFNKEGKKILRY